MRSSPSSDPASARSRGARTAAAAMPRRRRSQRLQRLRRRRAPRRARPHPTAAPSSHLAGNRAGRRLVTTTMMRLRSLGDVLRLLRRRWPFPELRCRRRFQRRRKNGWFSQALRQCLQRRRPPTFALSLRRRQLWHSHNQCIRRWQRRMFRLGFSCRVRSRRWPPLQRSNIRKCHHCRRRRRSCNRRRCSPPLIGKHSQPQRNHRRHCSSSSRCRSYSHSCRSRCRRRRRNRRCRRSSSSRSSRQRSSSSSRRTRSSSSSSSQPQRLRLGRHPRLRAIPAPLPPPPHPSHGSPPCSPRYARAAVLRARRRLPRAPQGQGAGSSSDFTASLHYLQCRAAPCLTLRRWRRTLKRAGREARLAQRRLPWAATLRRPPG